MPNPELASQPSPGGATRRRERGDEVPPPRQLQIGEFRPTFSLVRDIASINAR